MKKLQNVFGKYLTGKVKFASNKNRFLLFNPFTHIKYIFDVPRLKNFPKVQDFLQILRNNENLVIDEMINLFEL